MTKEQTKKVFGFYVKILKDLGYEPVNYKKFPEFSDDEDQSRVVLNHTLWMCEEAAGIADQDMDKAYRWLGFVQGALWSYGIFSIDDMREHNQG